MNGKEKVACVLGFVLLTAVFVVMGCVLYIQPATHLLNVAIAAILILSIGASIVFAILFAGEIQ